MKALSSTEYDTRMEEIIGIIRLLSEYSNPQTVGMLLAADHLRKKATMDDKEIFEEYCKIMEG